MKKFTIAILALLMVFAADNAKAQGKYGADSANCVKYLSFYKEYYKQKAFDEAIPNWRNAYRTCPPTANQHLLIDGTSLVRRLISQNAKDPVYKAALVDTLFTLHDLRAEYYPKYAVQALNNKAVDMSNYIKDDYATLFKGYNTIIDANKEETRVNVFIWDFFAALELYKLGQLNSEDILNCYQRNMEILEKVPAAENVQNVKTDLESLFISSKVASCEDLITLFTPRYEDNPEDLGLVTNIVKMLGITEDCQNNDLFLKAVTSMYKLQPSYNSAYYLFRLNAARGNLDEGLRYIDEAIASEGSDAATDAAYNFEAAALCFKNGRMAKAYSYANASQNADNSFDGKACFLMGQIWGTISCGGNEIERRAHYWVAVDYLNKAKNADSSLAEEANRLIRQYSVYFPEAAEAFMYNLTDGNGYSIVCNGISARTTVRTRK